MNQLGLDGSGAQKPLNAPSSGPVGEPLDGVFANETKTRYGNTEKRHSSYFALIFTTAVGFVQRGLNARSCERMAILTERPEALPLLLLHLLSLHSASISHSSS
jgi:hypothetical protein